MVGLLTFLAHFVLSETIIASLGASTFIVTSMPHAHSARPRYLIGGYACGIFAGLAGFLLASACPTLHFAFVSGIVVGLAIVLMVAFNFEHPPAAALSLGLIVSPNPPRAALLSFACIVLVCLLKHCFKDKMKDLL
jgi:CBS-domain-containing membrane protein